MPESTQEEEKNKDKPEKDKPGEDKGDTGNITNEDTGKYVDDDTEYIY